MHSPAETAVGAGDDVFSADDFSERNERSATSSGCSTRSVAWLTTPGNQDLPGGEFYVAPDFEFMFVTDVTGFDRYAWALKPASMIARILRASHRQSLLKISRLSARNCVVGTGSDLYLFHSCNGPRFR
jgi:hypothetical protein